MSEKAKPNLALFELSDKRQEYERMRQGEVLQGVKAMEQCPDETQDLIAFLFVQGLTLSEIAEKTQLDQTFIAGMRSDRVFQMRIVKYHRIPSQFSPTLLQARPLNWFFDVWRGGPLNGGNALFQP